MNLLPVNKDNLDTLANYLLQTKDNDKSTRSRASESLLQMEAHEGYGALLVHMIRDPTYASVQFSAVVNLKGYICRCWFPHENENYARVSDTDKVNIKKCIISLMLESTGSSRKLFCAAIEHISSLDFPQNWGDLLPELSNALMNSKDLNHRYAILASLRSVFHPYRLKPDTEPVLRELAYIMENFGETMFTVFQEYVSLIPQALDNGANLYTVLKALKTLVDIYYSLNAVDIPAVFQNHISDYMSAFDNILRFDSKLEEVAGFPDDEKPAILSKLKASILSSLVLYATRYDAFEPFLGDFAQTAWGLMSMISLQPSHDIVAMGIIQYLSCIAKSFQHNIFANTETLQLLCDHIIIPNTRFRESNQISFEEEPLQYIREDMEGSDTHTRRKMVADFIRSLRKHYDQQITGILIDAVTNMLTEHQTNPAEKWEMKDQAIFLVGAVAVESSTRADGVVTVNQFVPVKNFYYEHIQPELKAVSELLKSGNASNSALHIVVADALKFVFNFRNLLTSEDLTLLIPIIAQLLQYKFAVVSSYAALCIQVFLNLRTNGHFTYPQENLLAILNDLLSALFVAIDMPPIYENEYLMKAITRVIARARSGIVPCSQQCIISLTNKLGQIYKNPTSATFIHYIFESIASVLSHLNSESNFELIQLAESNLTVAFDTIFNEDIMELIPYVFQLRAQFISSYRNHPQQLVEKYGPDFTRYLVASQWERTGNVPALARVLESFIRYAPDFVVPHILPILGIFQKLLYSRSLDVYGFQILKSMIFCIKYVSPIYKKLTSREEHWVNHFQQVYVLICTRLQTAKTQAVVLAFISFTSCLILKLGVDRVIEIIEGVKSGVTGLLLTQVWLPNSNKLDDFVDRKTCVLALTALLDTCSSFPQSTPWNTMPRAILGSCIDLLHTLVDTKDDENEPDIEVGEQEFTSVYTKLAFSGNETHTFLNDQEDPTQYFLSHLQELSRKFPGTLTGIIQELPDKQRHGLEQMFQQSNLSMPYIY